jgi:hypothetical protein
MSDNYYFDGDPSTDSARRRLERILKEPPQRRRRWPWVLAAAAGVTAWYFWPRGKAPGEKTGSAPPAASNG